MSATTEEMTAIERYLEAVRAELADLPDDDRVEMLEDVKAHLLEVAAEDDEPLETRLGPPAGYAAELRAAAGLPPHVPAAGQSAGVGFAARVTRWPAVEALREVHRSVRHTAVYREVRTLGAALQPAWWIARAYIVTVTIGILTNGGGALSVFSRSRNLRMLGLLFPSIASKRLVGFVILLLLTAASVAWSRAAKGNRLLTTLTIAGNIVVVWAALMIFENIGGYGHFDSFASRPPPAIPSFGPPHATALGDVVNIYPYAADGTPLKNVLLYDQDGNPITGVVTDPYTEEYGYRDVNGQLVPNLFPYPMPSRDAQTGDVVGELPPPSIAPPAPANVATSERAAPKPTSSASPSLSP